MPSLLRDSPPPPSCASMNAETGASIRKASRNGDHTTVTSGFAPSYLQANLIILPSRYADDFRILCARNPVPCPLMAESSSIGSWDSVKSYIPGLSGEQIVSSVDIRQDAPKYMVYKNGKLAKFQCRDIVDTWTDDHVAFLIGCSFSFESALTNAGLPPRHSQQRRNVPMYRTKLQLCPAGVFKDNTYVVSMRPYKLSEIEKIRDITRAYTAVHGEPLDWGWDAIARLGISDIDHPEWGDEPFNAEGKPLSYSKTRDERRGTDPEVPVFWGCGVTPQNAVMQANLKGTIMSHAPGHMLVSKPLRELFCFLALLCLQDWNIFQPEISPCQGRHLIPDMVEQC
jgi:uncharacterized protein YcsI (UPF0317 family)